MNAAFSRSLIVKLFRDFRERPMRAAGVVLVIAGAVAFPAGISMALGSIGETLGRFYRQTSFADLELRFMPEDRANLPDFGAVASVEKWESRLVMPSLISLPAGGTLSGVLISRSKGMASIDSFQTVQGRPADWHTGNAWIEQSLAKYHGFGLGGEIRSQVGGVTYADTIAGIVTSPEFFCSASNPDFALPEKGSLGVVFADLDRIADALGFTPVNDVVFRYRADANPAETEKAILALLPGRAMDRIMPQAEHFSHKNIMLRVRNYEMFSGSIILTMLALALIMATFTFGRMIMEQRGEVGVLAAMGYRRRAIVTSYMTAAAALGCAAAAVAIPVSLALRNVFVGSFAKTNGMAFVERYGSFSAFLLAGAGAILIASLGMLIPLSRLLALPPIRILKPTPAVEAGGGAIGRRMARWEGRLAMPVAYALRNFRRAPLKSALGIGILAFAMGVPISYGISLTSSRETMARQFGREGWQVAVDFLHPMFMDELDSLRRLGLVARAEPFFRSSGAIRFHGRTVDARILGVAPGSDFRPVVVIEGESLTASAEAGRIVLSQDIAGDLGARPGDTVGLFAAGVEQAFRVQGITSDLFTRQAILGLTAAQKAFQAEDKASGAYLEMASGRTPTDLPHGLYGVLSRKAGMLANLTRRWRDSLVIVYVTIAFSSLMGMAYIIMNFTLMVMERRREYSTLLSLGVVGKEIFAVILTETALQFGLAVILSFPMGILLALRFNRKLAEYWFAPEFYARASDFLIPLLGLSACLPVVVLIGYRKIVSLDLGRELRYREIA